MDDRDCSGGSKGMPNERDRVEGREDGRGEGTRGGPGKREEEKTSRVLKKRGGEVFLMNEVCLGWAV